MKSLITALLLTYISTVAGFAADGPVRHIVAFKFKPDADPAAIKKVEADFAALKSKIPLIQSLEWGTNVSPEDRAKGFTHCWIATFKNTQDRDAYSTDPAHKAFAAGLKDIVADVFVFDFVAQEK